MGRRKRQEQEPSRTGEEELARRPLKQQKATTTKEKDEKEEKDDKNNVAAQVDHDSHERPKSKKELRDERKAARRSAEAQAKIAQRQEKKHKNKEAWHEVLRQERQERKERQRSKRKTKEDTSNKRNNIANENSDEIDVARKVVDEIKYGCTDASSGMTTLPQGVQYKDVVVGQGPIVENHALLTVKYKLTAKSRFGNGLIVLDSSNKFNFRLGRSEVITGWDIGMQGMRVGGRRQLIIPPKAGYGSQDIGAGPGAVLYFDVALLAMRGK